MIGLGLDRCQEPLHFLRLVVPSPIPELFGMRAPGLRPEWPSPPSATRPDRPMA